jgi:hypothetical protein
MSCYHFYSIVAELREITWYALVRWGVAVKEGWRALLKMQFKEQRKGRKLAKERQRSSSFVRFVVPSCRDSGFFGVPSIACPVT